MIESPCSGRTPRMRGVNSLPFLNRQWSYKSKRAFHNHRPGTNAVVTPPKSRSYYSSYQNYWILTTLGIILLTGISIKTSFAPYRSIHGRIALDGSVDAPLTPSCTETSNTSKWFQTPVHDPRFFQTYTRLSDFLDGHTSDSEMDAPTLNDLSGAAAICVFRTNDQYWKHFPHTMQQLYRCTSWWLANYPKRQPILLMGQYKQLFKSEFVAGYLQFLQTTIGLQVKRRHKDSAPYPATLTVRSRNTGKWKRDIDITDFALLDPQRQLRNLFLSKIVNDTQASDQSCREKKNPRIPRIAILNRHMASGRHILNAPAIANALHTAFPSSHSVPIVYFENKSFIDQIRFFATEADIVITPHGAQLTGMAFLPPCTSVLELFPPDYLVPDYFGSLAAAINISHSFLYLGGNYEDDNTILPHEKYHYYVPNDENKDDAQCPNRDKLVDAVQNMVQNWQSCCSASTDEQTIPSSPQRTADSRTDAPIVDIVSVSLTGAESTMPQQPSIAHVQAAALSAHPLVRQYYSMTAINDTSNDACRNDMTTKQAYWSAFCHSGITRRDRASVSRMIRSDLLQPSSSSSSTTRKHIHDSTPEEWCAQKRFISGWHKVLEQYRGDSTRRPDFLMLLPEHTYVNVERVIDALQQWRHTPQQVVASCTNITRPKDLHLVYPTAPSVSIFPRAALDRLLEPLYCDNRGGVAAKADASSFTQWACWRLWQNHLGERSFFRNGMSIGDLLWEYSSQIVSSTSIKKWHHVGYCLESHHLLGYFVSFYHISVPDFVLQQAVPQDRVRPEFSIQSLGEDSRACINESMPPPCTSNSSICHSITSMEQMQQLYSQQDERT